MDLGADLPKTPVERAAAATGPPAPPPAGPWPAPVPAQAEPLAAPPVAAAPAARAEPDASAQGSLVGGWLRRGVVAALLLAAAAAILWHVLPARVGQPGPEERWAEIQSDCRSHKWSRLPRKLGHFEQDFPDDARTPLVPFFRDLCQAGPEVDSPTGDPQQALQLLRQMLQDYRGSPAYEQYGSEVFDALARLIERITGQAMETASLGQLAQARQAQQLLGTVAETPEQQEQAAKLSAKISQTEADVKFAVAWRAICRTLMAGARAGPQGGGPDPEEVDEQLRQFRAAYPKLPAEKRQELERLLKQARWSRAKP